MLLRLCVGVTYLLFSRCVSATQDLHLNPEKVKGPDACGECHEDEMAIWKKTKHSTTFTKLPRKEKAKEIADRMGIKRIKADSDCLNCHFTSDLVGEKVKPIAGITCESCHSAGQDWIDGHSDFGGKDVKAEDETSEHKKQRYAEAEKAGMIRPKNLYDLARNCFSCHTVPNEKLVNIGEHKAGSKFELVRWSQGDLRHNVWYSKENKEASLERRRMMFLIGQVLDLEYGLRGLAKATKKAAYATAMAKRTQSAQRRVEKLATVVESKELNTIVETVKNTDLKLNNSSSLLAAADKISSLAQQLVSKYDGSQFVGFDAYLPKPEKYKKN